MKGSLFLLIVTFLVLMLAGPSSGLDFFTEPVETSEAEKEAPPVEKGSPQSPGPSGHSGTPSGLPRWLPQQERLTPSELEAYRSKYLSVLRAVQRGGLPRRLIYVYPIDRDDTVYQEAVISAKRRDPSLNISAFAVIDCSRTGELMALSRSPLRKAGVEVFVDCENSILSSYKIDELPALVIDDHQGRPSVFTGPGIVEILR